MLENVPMGEELVTVVVTGLVVVFAVLILLTFLIWGYGQLIYRLQNRSKDGTPKGDAPKKSEPAAKTAAPGKAPMQASSQGISNEILAVIAAAVASMSPSGVQYSIRSIRREGSARPAWRSASVYENTRPFSS